jgi:mono/diheme cytochrome c family protein
MPPLVSSGAMLAVGLPDNRELLAPSVHHITSVFAPRVFKTVQPPWKDASGHSVSPPESATIANAVEAVVKPHSAKMVSPRDRKRGAAYVDTLTSEDHVGRATALLSCAY